MTTRIGFPGLGIEMFEMNRTAFTVFGVDIQWYGILLSTGIVLAFLLFYRLGTKQEHIKADDIYNVTLFTVPVAIIGARFVYVITNWDSYKGKGFLNMINIRGGGIAIYGAIIFGLLTVIVYNRVKKVGTLSMLDALAPAVMLGQTIGRWGNFVNGEAYGSKSSRGECSSTTPYSFRSTQRKYAPPAASLHTRHSFMNRCGTLSGFASYSLCFTAERSSTGRYSLHIWAGTGSAGALSKCSAPIHFTSPAHP